jgi:hypothetical protein
MYHLVELCATLTLNIGKRQGSSSTIFSPWHAMARTAPIRYGIGWSVAVYRPIPLGECGQHASQPRSPAVKVSGLPASPSRPAGSFIKTETDKGVTGWGEPVAEGRAAAPVAEFMGEFIGGTALISAASARSPGTRAGRGDRRLV